MRKRLSFFLFLLAMLLQPALAEQWFTVTLSVTNTAGTTNGQSYTVSGTQRTWTNSVFVPASQILTNSTTAGAAANMLVQASAYPFSGVQIYSAANGFTIRSNAYFAVTISPGWGLITRATNSVGVSAISVAVPFSSYSTDQQTNVASLLWRDLDIYSQTRNFTNPVNFLGRGEFDAGFGLHGRGLIATNYTLTTNDLYIGADTRANTNLILTLPTAASASNLLFLIKDEGGAGATNTVKIYPAAGDRIDTLLTNLVVSNNFGGVMLRSRGSTNWAILASGGGVTGGIGGSGGGTWTNTVWVSQNGSDVTGARGDPGKPFLTWGGANTAATNGDTIFVLPGNYNEGNIGLKDRVNWHFFNGVADTYTGAHPVFSDASNITVRITGHGVFTNANTGGQVVLDQETFGSDIYFQCLAASTTNDSSYYYTIISSAGTLRIAGGQIFGWHSPALLIAPSSTNTVTIDGAVIDSTSNDQSSLGSAIRLGSDNCNLTIRNSTLLGSNDGSWGATDIYSIYSSGGSRTVTVDGIVADNLPHNPDVIYAAISYDGRGLETLPGNVSIIGTNTAAAFVGDGSGLTGIPGQTPWTSDHDAAGFKFFAGPIYSLLTNAAFLATDGDGLIYATNLNPPSIVQTNFILNTVYTAAGVVSIRATATLTTAAVNGGAILNLLVDQAGGTSFVLLSQAHINTLITGLALTDDRDMTGFLNAGATYYWTNASTGAGNSAAIHAGTGQVMQH